MACGTYRTLLRTVGRWGPFHALRAISCSLLLLLSFAAAQATLTSAQEARAQAIGRTIRCPVCQGEPITESPSDLSHQMMRDLRQQVVAGRSDEQIETYFAARYGQSVLLDPPRQGANLLLWLAPPIALLLGGGWLLLYLRRRAPTGGPPPEEGPEDDYLRQVRTEAHRGRS